MAAKRLFEDKKPFSITFVQDIAGSNDVVQWTKVNFMFPPNATPPTFKDIHNSFLSLDTKSFPSVIDALGIRDHMTTNSYGKIDTRFSDLVLDCSIIYYIK